MQEIRFPLIEDVESRRYDHVKDALTVNATIEVATDTTKYAVKRAGTTQKVTGTGTGQGIFVYNGTIYQWDSGTTALSPRQTLVSSL